MMTDVILLNPKKTTPNLFIGCVGYEHRSLEAYRKNIASGFNGHSLIFDYCSGDLFSYPENRYDKSLDQAELINDFDEFLDAASKCILEHEQNSVLLDSTSFDREKLALILKHLFDLASSISTVTICYFPRSYCKPTHSLDVVRSFGPVIPAFIGESSYSRDSLTLIVGAGYEYGRAVGAIDILEPDRIYCMTPVGTDPRFEDEIVKNNLEFSFLEDDELLLPYNLLKPEFLFYEVRRIVEFEIQERNVLILPMGPKVFAAVSIMVALILHPSVMVWRHSTATANAPSSTSDATASGVDIRFSFKFIE